MERLSLKSAQGEWIARSLFVARSFADRLRGVHKLGALPAGTGLMLSPCTSIHTFGMRFAIDVLFLNAQLRVLRIAEACPPWRICWAPFGTKHVVELPAGTLKSVKLEPGMFVCIHPASDAGAARRVPCAKHLNFSLQLSSDELKGLHARCTLTRQRARERRRMLVDGVTIETADRY